MLGPFSSSDIFMVLSSLPLKFSSDPDNIPPFILRNCAEFLAGSLSVLFNKSLSSGVYPNQWKPNFVFPIFKADTGSNVASYRGVRIQSSIPKVLDKLVFARLSFACRHFFSEYQHRFMAKRSTITNLLCYQYDILSSLQSRKEVHTREEADVAKAFDRVDSKFLVAKLRSYGIGDVFSIG